MFGVLRHLLGGENQFASEGLLLMIVGGLGVYLRKVPEKLWEWCVNQTTMMITVKNDDAAFVWVKEWLLEQEFLKRIRRVDMDTTVRHEQMALIPAPGRHWFWCSGRPFQVEFYRGEKAKGRYLRRSEEFTFRTIGRGQEFLIGFVNGIVECHKQKAALSASLFVYDDYWTKVPGYTARRIESVILAPGEKEHLLHDIGQFRQAKERYRQLGVPYHRGYLFYGPPGTGKTSLVSALAANFGMSIYAVSLSDFNDKTLMRAIQDVPQNSVILFEDIDCMKVGAARHDCKDGTKEQNPGVRGNTSSSADRFSVTLSGLLNVLDGFSAPENVLFVMTTNKIDVLDRALLRPGRIDYRLYLGKARTEQKIELYRRFFPQASLSEAVVFVEVHAAAGTMAEFQGLLLSLSQEGSTEATDRVFQDA